MKACHKPHLIYW